MENENGYETIIYCSCHRGHSFFIRNSIVSSTSNYERTSDFRLERLFLTYDTCVTPRFSSNANRKNDKRNKTFIEVLFFR